MENKKEEEKERLDMPTHVKTFDPENPPFETLRLCVYLRELEEEKEEEELDRTAEPALHK